MASLWYANCRCDYKRKCLTIPLNSEYLEMLLQNDREIFEEVVNLRSACFFCKIEQNFILFPLPETEEEICQKRRVKSEKK